MKEENEKVQVDETFSIKFEDPIPTKRIKQEPLEERKAFAEVATQTEKFETDVEVLKSEIQNLKQRVDSGFKEANERMTSEIKNLQQRVDSGFKEVIERMARNQETIEKSDGLNSQQTVLVKSKVNSEVDKNQPDSNDVLKPELEEWKRKVQGQLEDLNDDSEAGMLKTLTKLQYEILLENGDVKGDISLVAFAKTVVSQILTFLRRSHKKAILEEMMNKYFLVDAYTVSKRKGSDDVTARDHKLQILFRMEVSWLAPQQDLQKSYLEEILVHLRQISIWDSPNEMLSFMQEILAIIYVNDQPEVDIKEICRVLWFQLQVCHLFRSCMRYMRNSIILLHQIFVRYFLLPLKCRTTVLH